MCVCVYVCIHIKEALWGGAFVASQQNCANQCIDARSKRERKKQRDRTGSEQLKGYKAPIVEMGDSSSLMFLVGLPVVGDAYLFTYGPTVSLI